MSESTFPIWKTITLGTHKSVSALKTSLNNAGIRVEFCAEKIMGKAEFTLAKEERELELVVASVRELGFDDGARYDAICARIRDLGYELCPPEVGPQLMLQYPDQPQDEWLIIAMEPITVSDAVLGVFRVVRDYDARWLRPHCEGPGGFLNSYHRFVFPRRKTSPTS